MLPLVSGLYENALNLYGVYKLNFSILLETWEIFKYLFFVKNSPQNMIQERVFRDS